MLFAEFPVFFTVKLKLKLNVIIIALMTLKLVGFSLLVIYFALQLYVYDMEIGKQISRLEFKIHFYGKPKLVVFN